MFLSVSVYRAQESAYVKLKQLVAVSQPGLVLENKLIAFNVWSVNDPVSRETNKDFEKAFRVYESARLRGGSKGIVVIAINRDNLSEEALQALSGDGVTQLLKAGIADWTGDSAGIHNIVYDAEGREVYRNLAPGAVYNSIRQLITR